MTTKRWVIVHPQYGVYLGNSMGFGYFSLLDTAGRTCAVTFPDENAAKAHVRSWDNLNDPDQFVFFEVRTGGQSYADLGCLMLAAIPQHYLEPLLHLEMAAVRHAKESGARFH